MKNNDLFYGILNLHVTSDCTSDEELKVWGEFQNLVT